MTPRTDTSLSIKVLKETIAWFKKQIEPHDCGWMIDTISGIKHRIDFLRKELKKIDNSEKEINHSIS